MDDQPSIGFSTMSIEETIGVAAPKVVYPDFVTNLASVCAAIFCVVGVIGKISTFNSSCNYYI